MVTKIPHITTDSNTIFVIVLLTKESNSITTRRQARRSIQHADCTYKNMLRMDAVPKRAVQWSPTLRQRQRNRRTQSQKSIQNVHLCKNKNAWLCHQSVLTLTCNLAASFTFFLTSSTDSTKISPRYYQQDHGK